MKEIWINLELYINKYDFYNLGNFFGFLNRFSYFIVDFLNPFLINKKIKMGVGPAWMRRGTRGHVVVPRRPAQRLRGA